MRKIFFLVCCTLCLSWSASAFDSDRIQIHGFASQGYLRSSHYDYLGAETEKGTVEFNEFGLNVMSNLTDRLRLGIQLLARDLGDTGNDNIGIDWAFGDYRYRNWLGLRVGQFTRALGLYNQSRDIDAARTGVFLPLSMYNEMNRVSQKSVKGLSLYGTIPGSFTGSFEYQMQYGTLDSGFMDSLLARSGTKSAEVADNAYVLNLKWNTPLEGLRLVGTLSHFSWSTVQTVNTTDTTTKTDLEFWLAGIEYTRGNITCATEYNERTFKMSQFEYTSVFYYGLLSYRFTDWFELASVYAVTYMNKDDKEGKNYVLGGMPKAAAWSKDVALSARFDINEYWIVKLEGHWINGLSWASGYGTNPDENGFLGAAKVTFSF